MTTKKHLFLSGALLLGIQAASAQFVVGGEGFFIKSGTTVFIDSLVMTPNADLTIVNNSIAISRAAIPGVPKGSVARVYQFGAPISYSGVIGFFYTNSELNGNTEPELTLSYNSTTGQIGFVNTSPANASSNFVSQTLASPTTLQQVTAAASASALPVSLLSFSVRPDGHKVKIEWETASERNNKGFEIDRSPDAVRFMRLATVDGRGTISSRQKYQLVDDSPEPTVTYYRLRQVDFDGTVKDYGIKSVVFDSPNHSLKVVAYPNPVTSRLSLLLPDGRPRSLKVDWLDPVTGRRLSTESIEAVGAEQPLTIPSGLRSGLYLLRVNSGDISESVRISLQK